ncbi:Flp/Fap pilin component [Pelotomaculum sp. FP]|uniref:Flp family type IVb pilin n=1 Tax=Pelotomaculum sp. FP TaxID=261474 RepID=UPI001065715D|nr:Flp family type IVb pilin [Pelotomaculum sp. FP]TEB12142.1 Flp/Fap pilin component [Pelotomaculum sp. FP]
MAKLWNLFLSEESGQGMVEYGLIVALIAVMVVGTLKIIGEDLLAKFNTISDHLK